MATSKTSKGVVGAAPQEKGQRDRFLERKAWFSMEMQRQNANRYQMAMDEDYYDSIQWTSEEAREVRMRGQNPVVYNEVAPTIDWLIGTERRMRRDFKVLARTSKSKEAGADAELKTKLLKYLDDVNRSPFERSQAFDDAMKAGLGWLEVGVRADPEDEPIYLRSESWRYMLHDSLNQSRDINQGRYTFRFREVDLDIAIANFPDKERELRSVSNDNTGMFGNDTGWANGWPLAGSIGSDAMPAKWIQFDSDAMVLNPRKRVTLIECWAFEPTRETTGKGGFYDRVKMKMHVSIMTELDTLLEAWTPYNHNRFPFIPVWAYRRKKDGLPYGPIRRIRGPQDDLNKRMSKSLFMMSVNQIDVEKGAIDKESMDLETLREENAASDGMLVWNNGALSGNKVRRREHIDLAQGHLAIADQDRIAIRSASGVTGENRGMETSSGQSGKAIIAKQDQGSMVTAELFDSMLLAHQMEGEMQIALIEQWYDEAKTFSVTGDRFKLDYYEINNPDPNDPTGQTKLNDVTRHKAQFVIGEAPWRQALAEAAFESAMNMLAQLAPVAPQVVVAIIDLIFEWSDLPNKQILLQRIRGATGQSDPDEGETPEQQQKKARETQLANAQFEAELTMLQATVKEAKAKGVKLEVEAIQGRLEALLKAANAAQIIVSVPQIAPVADELARSSGFKEEPGDAPLGGPVQTVQPAMQGMQGMPQQANGGMPPQLQGQPQPPPEGVIQ